MNSTNRHELAVELIGTTFQDIIGAPLSDFPDTPLTLEIFDKMEEYIDKFKNDTEKLKIVAGVLVRHYMEDILAGNW